MVGLLALALLVPFFRDFLALEFPTWVLLFITLGIALDAVLLFEYAQRVIAWYQRKRRQDG
jgi:hypothetical protein